MFHEFLDWFECLGLNFPHIFMTRGRALTPIHVMQTTMNMAREIRRTGGRLSTIHDFV